MTTAEVGVIVGGLLVGYWLVSKALGQSTANESSAGSGDWRAGDTSHEALSHGAFAFIRKHFDGDYSLGRSYWVNLFLLAQMLVTVLATIFLTWLGEQDIYPRYISAAVLAVLVGAIVAWAWGIKGTWASSRRHVARGGKAFWAGAARFFIVLGVLATLGQVGSRLPELREHLRVALGEQPGPSVTLQIFADGRSILLQGGINDGAAEALVTALDVAPSVKTVVLHSGGGWVREGERLARVIAERHLDTYVEEECTSACTIAFLAGIERSAEPNARIGFHSIRPVGGISYQNRAAVEREGELIYRRAGISSAFIARVIETPPGEIWYPSHVEMLDAGVLTRTSLGGAAGRGDGDRQSTHGSLPANAGAPEAPSAGPCARGSTARCAAARRSDRPAVERWQTG